MDNYRPAGLVGHSSQKSFKLEFKPIKLDRIVHLSPEIASEHACYICGFYALDPRQCFNITQMDAHCEALFCLACLRQYLQAKPYCPKCRTQSQPEQFKRPSYNFWV